MIGRRGFLLGSLAAGLVAAPALVHPSSLMPLRGVRLPRSIFAIGELLDAQGNAIRSADVCFEEVVGSPGPREWRAGCSWPSFASSVEVHGWRVRNFMGCTLQGDTYRQIMTGCSVRLDFNCTDAKQWGV